MASNNNLNLGGVVIPLSDETVHNLLVQLGVKTPIRVHKFFCMKPAGIPSRGCLRAKTRNGSTKTVEAPYHIGMCYSDTMILQNLTTAQDNSNVQSDFFTREEVVEMIKALQEMLLPEVTVATKEPKKKRPVKK